MEKLKFSKSKGRNSFKNWLSRTKPKLDFWNILMNLHTKHQINIWNPLEIRYGKLFFSKFKGRNSLKKQWSGTKLKLDLWLIKIELHTKIRFKMCKGLEQKSIENYFTHWHTDRRTDGLTDRVQTYSFLRLRR